MDCGYSRLPTLHGIWLGFLGHLLGWDRWHLPTTPTGCLPQHTGNTYFPPLAFPPTIYSCSYHDHWWTWVTPPYLAPITI